MTKYKRWVNIYHIDENALRDVVKGLGLKLKSFQESGQWHHLYIETTKKLMNDFDNFLKSQKIEYRNRKPKGAKDIGPIINTIGRNFEYHVRNRLNELGFYTQRRAGSGNAKGQKGDIIIFDKKGNELLTLETTKTRGKGIWISEDKLNKLLNGESEAIIFSTGDSTIKFTMIPFEAVTEPDMNFIEYLEYYLRTHKKEVEE